MKDVDFKTVTVIDYAILYVESRINTLEDFINKRPYVIHNARDWQVDSQVTHDLMMYKHHLDILKHLQVDCLKRGV